VVLLLVAPGGPLSVAVDDSLFRRSGRRVHGAGWQHDGSAGRAGFGTCFVTAGIVVALPFCTRPGCLPVLAPLALPGTKARPAGRGHRPGAGRAARLRAAVALVPQWAGAFPGRAVQVAADAAYPGPALKQLPASVPWTTRLPANAVLSALAPPRLPGERGRPCLKGLRLGTPAELAAAATWTPVTVQAYGRSHRTDLAARTCLCYGCLHTRTVRVILARDRAGLLALVTTDL